MYWALSWDTIIVYYFYNGQNSPSSQHKVLDRHINLLISLQTRMHSSRMRTARSSSRPEEGQGGSPPGTPPGTRHPRDQAPLRADLPKQTLPSRPPSRPPRMRTAHSSSPRDQAPRSQTRHPPPGTRHPPPGPGTLPQTSFAGGNKLDNKWIHSEHFFKGLEVENIEN